MILCCMMLHVELVGFAFGATKLIPRIQKACLSWHVSGTEDRCVTKRKRIHWGMFQVLLRGVLQWQLVGLPSQAVHCPWTPHHSCFWQGKIPSWEQVSKKYVKHVVTFLHLILLLSDQCVFQGLDLQHYDLLHLPKIWVGSWSWRCSTYFGIMLEVARSVNIYRANLRLMERSWSTAHWIPLRSLCPGWNGSDWHLLQINANVCSELCRCLPRRDFNHVHDTQMPISHPIPPFRCVFLHSFPQQLHSASPSTTRTKTAKAAQIFVNDTIAALDRTVSITLEDPSGQAPRVSNHQEVLGYDSGYDMYPLVNCYITIENHHFSRENPLFQWPFSIAMLVYQRVHHVLCEPPLCIETSWNGRFQ